MIRSNSSLLHLVITSPMCMECLPAASAAGCVVSAIPCSLQMDGWLLQAAQQRHSFSAAVRAFSASALSPSIMSVMPIANSSPVASSTALYTALSAPLPSQPSMRRRRCGSPGSSTMCPIQRSSRSGLRRGMALADDAGAGAGLCSRLSGDAGAVM